MRNQMNQNMKSSIKLNNGYTSRFKDQLSSKSDSKSSAKLKTKLDNKVENKINRKLNDKSNNEINSKPSKQLNSASNNHDTLKKKQAKSGCEMIKLCGACNYQEGKYHFHLKEKQKLVEKLMKPYGNVLPIIGMDNPKFYRNKVHATFGRLKNGTIIAGTYEAKTHHVISIDHCMIENEEADQIINDIKNLLKSFKIKTYDEDTGYGLLRRVLVRTARKTGEIMVVLVLGSPIMPSKNNFVKAIRKLHPNISTVIVNVNDKKTSMILGEKEQIIYGKGYITDELCGLQFRISSKSFYQVNPIQTEVLYKKAIKFAELTGKERVIDAYCGIGTIGMIASKHAKEVIGVELNKDAIRDAAVNAKKNEVKNIHFVCGDAGEFMTNMALQDEHADVVFMDPPRAGSDEAFLGSVIKLSPDRIVYISCNPITLECDVKYLTKKGYEVKKIQPVDMFPWTEHVECVVLMSRVDK